MALHDKSTKSAIGELSFIKTENPFGLGDYFTPKKTTSMFSSESLFGADSPSAFSSSSFKPMDTTQSNNWWENTDYFKDVGSLKGKDKAWYQDGELLEGWAAAGSALTQFAMIGPQLKAFRQNLKESEFNLGRSQIAADKKDLMYANLNPTATA